MSYLHDDDQSEMESLKDKVDNMQSQILDGAGSAGLENVDSGPNSNTESNPSSRHNPRNDLPSDLGDITSPLVIDFRKVNNRSLTGNVSGNLIITFVNIPVLLEMTLRLYIRSTDPIITIDGTIASGVGSSPLVETAVDDFLDISLSSINQTDVIIGTVKKNDETELPPDPPQNIQVIGNSASTINVIWDPPVIGTQPITYDIAWSTSPAGSAANGPDTPAAGSPDNDLTSNEYNITGLVSATTYYVWIRAKNDQGTSDWIGGHQTNTDGISNPGGVNFAIPGGSVLWDSITITWDQPGGALFSLTRTNTVTGEVEELQVFDVSDVDVVDDKGILPSTNYDYKLIVHNGFGTNIGSGTINVTSADLPSPVFTLASPARSMDATVTFPPRMSIVIIEVSDTSIFTDIRDTRQHSRPVTGDWETEEDLLFKSAALLPNTLYYVRMRFIKNQNTGPNSANQSSTTGNLLSPSQPTITMSSPSTGVARVKVRFNDDPTRDEVATVTWRLQSSVGPYSSFPGNVYARNDQQNGLWPPDDLDDREDRIEVLRTGGWPNGVLLTFRCQLSNLAGDSLADTENVTIDT